jgi:hypothetical protein
VNRLGEFGRRPYGLAGGVVGAGAGVVFVPSDFAGTPRSDFGTLGSAGLVAGSHPTDNAPTHSVRTIANGFRIVIEPLFDI